MAMEQDGPRDGMIKAEKMIKEGYAVLCPKRVCCDLCSAQNIISLCPCYSRSWQRTQYAAAKGGVVSRTLSFTELRGKGGRLIEHKLRAKRADFFCFGLTISKLLPAGLFILSTATYTSWLLIHLHVTHCSWQAPEMILNLWQLKGSIPKVSLLMFVVDESL